MKNISQYHKYFIFIFFLFTGSTTTAAYRAPVWSQNGMAATPHSTATDAAVEILTAGGNAIDAAVAAAFALSVVEQYHSGLGGGEFAVLYMSDTDETIAIDARECAPAAATPDMYINPQTNKSYEKKSYRGGWAVGVPGSVAGRVELVKKYGKLSLAEVIAPALKLAEEGFTIDRIMASRIKSYQDQLAEYKTAQKVFFNKGQPLKRGELLKQPQLARTLTSISSDNGKSFYHGKLAKQIVAACRDKGGILSTEDLANYKVIQRDPIRFDYRGYTIYSMPPPSSGGVCLAEILNILEGFPMDYLEQGEAESYHLIASAFEAAFADRSKWLGDPDFTPIPVEGLISTKYADKLRKNINRHYRNPVKESGDPWTIESEGNTSHLSVIDSEGNMCAITTSVNTSFGSLVYVPEMGIFLNSTMDDFAKSPGEPNKWDLIGNNVNAVAPGKRPLSSMSPTLVFKDDKPYMCIGSVGGPRIITSVAQIIINVIDFGINIQSAIDAPRIHTQWKPDKLYIEKEIPPEVAEELRKRGWKVHSNNHWSLSQGVLFKADTGDFYGASDARGVGTAGPMQAR
ncbi:MAG: gamma-glutamyltransferase [Candidatus Hatepunaea meridiana]|nr:gamma-glutamyltransferase [Candidatus Hatepunaea meridiana]